MLELARTTDKASSPNCAMKPTIPKIPRVMIQSPSVIVVSRPSSALNTRRRPPAPPEPYTFRSARKQDLFILESTCNDFLRVHCSRSGQLQACNWWEPNHRPQQRIGKSNAHQCYRNQSSQLGTCPRTGGTTGWHKASTEGVAESNAQHIDLHDSAAGNKRMTRVRVRQQAQPPATVATIAKMPRKSMSKKHLGADCAASIRLVTSPRQKYPYNQMFRGGPYEPR